MKFCPQCGAGVQSGQKFCSKCGAKFVEPAAPPSPPAGGGAERTLSTGTRPAMNKKFILLAAVSAVVLALIFVAVYLLATAKEEEPAEVAEEPDARSVTNAEPAPVPAPVQANEITLARTAVATASSYDRDGDNIYQPANVLDGRPDTTWTEANAGYGEGEWLELRFDRAYTLSRIGLVPGYVKTLPDRHGDRFYKNTRVKSAVLSWSGGSMQIVAQDQPVMQFFNLPSPTTDFIRITIQSVYPGSQWKDTCISEVEVWGQAASAPVAAAPAGGENTPFWAISVGAFDARAAAEQQAAKFSQYGFSTGILWIPDYSSLSGKPLWMAYVGPYPYGQRDQVVSQLQQVKSHKADAYAIKVDHSGLREQL